MNSIAGRATGLAPYLSATVNVIPPSTRPIITEFAKKAEKLVSEPRPLITSSYGLSKAFLSTGSLLNGRATVGLTSESFEYSAAYTVCVVTLEFKSCPTFRNLRLSLQFLYTGSPLRNRSFVCSKNSAT